MNPTKFYSEMFHSLGVVFKNKQNNSLPTEIDIKIKLTGFLIMHSHFNAQLYAMIKFLNLSSLSYILVCW